ncbi:MAG: hypothetical protein WEA09_14370 [Gemmatimonadota bacterium]
MDRSSSLPAGRFRSGPRLSGMVALLLLAGACGGEEAPPVQEAASPSADIQSAFLDNLRALCGKAFAGEATLASGGGFEEGLIMHIRRCEDDEIQIPLHAGENRSRTWIITRTSDGLRLKHDHRLEDGSDDPVTQYGGDTTEPGTPTRQSFHADAFTAELIPEAETNIWTMTLTPGERFVYHLTRHDAPRATFEFDLTQEVELPPAPWGHEGA